MGSSKTALRSPPGDDGSHTVPVPDPAGPVAPAVDERDAAIERLERLLAEERQNSATLRETLDGLRFKAEILEKSYAKQLADTRQRLTAAEQTLADHRAKATAFGSDHEETIRLLTEARTELAQVKLDCDQLRRQQTRGGASFDRAPLTTASAEPTDGGTINQLIANPDWLKKKEAASAGSHLEARVSAENEGPVADMISPDLVFTKDGDRDDEDDEP